MVNWEWDRRGRLRVREKWGRTQYKQYYPFNTMAYERLADFGTLDQQPPMRKYMLRAFREGCAPE